MKNGWILTNNKLFFGEEIVYNSTVSNYEKKFSMAEIVREHEKQRIFLRNNYIWKLAAYFQNSKQ